VRDNAPSVNLPAEQSIIGSCLINGYALDVAAESLLPEDFYLTAHCHCFRLMLELRSKGKDVDLVTLCSALKDAGLLDSIGGASYLMSCADMVPTTRNVDHYADIVRETSLRRALVAFGESVDKSARDTSVTARETQDHLETELLRIGADRAETSHSLRDSVTEAHEKLMEGGSGMPLSIRSLSHIPLADGVVTLVLGYRGMGKTRFLLGEIIDKCRQGIPCLFLSLEMSESQVLHALMAIGVGIPLFELQTQAKGNPHWIGTYEAVRDEIAQWPLTISDTPSRDISSIAATCRRWVRENHHGLILLDYVQLVHAKGHNALERLDTAAAGLREMARQVSVPVLATAQLTIVNQEGPLGTPEAHVKGSKTFEEVSESVIVLNRPSKRMADDNPEKEEWSGKATANVTKNRNGIVEGVTTIGWRERVGCFCDLAQDSPAPVPVQPPRREPIYEAVDPDIDYGDPFND
jgi:replicative DNA helicase